MCIEMLKGTGGARERSLHVDSEEPEEGANRKPWAMVMLERRFPNLWYGHVQHVAGV